MPNSVLIVDDEEGIRRTLAGVLSDEGFSVDTAASGEECLAFFERRLFRCVLLDVWLPGMDGIETLERLKSAYPDTAVIMISGHGSIETAVRATRLGALDFIEKPLQIDRTVVAVRNALRQRQLEADNLRLRQQLDDDNAMIGESVPIRALRQQIGVAAPTNGRILIYGESGTGKELAARAIHPGITDPNLVLPTLLVEQLSPALGALALAAVFSAEVNTCDALLFMLSTSLSQDLYKRFLRPQATDAQLLRVARWAAFAGGVGGVLFALRLATVIDALKIFYSLLGVTLLVPVIGGLYVRRAGSVEALVSMAAGIATLLVVRFAFVARHPWMDPTAAGLVAAAIAFGITLLIRTATPNPFADSTV